LDHLIVGRTTFVIAHRLHTLTNVDKIYILKEGAIVDQGSHNELISRDGYYKTVWDKQQAEMLNLQQPNDGYSGWGHTNLHSHTHLSSDMRALLDLLNSHSERLKDQYPDIHSMLRQVRPEKRNENKRYTGKRKAQISTSSARELKSVVTREGSNISERHSLLVNYESQDEYSSTSSSSSGFF